MILIVDNYDSFTFNLYHLCAKFIPQVEVVRNDKITFEQLVEKPLLAIILSPGPGKPSEAGICIPLVQNFSGKIPILGVCLGHQAIGEAFGARVTRAPLILHGKSSAVFHRQRDLFSQVEIPFLVARYHSLHIEEGSLPQVLSVQARAVDGTIMAVRHLTHPTFGIQFHPESFLTEAGDQLMRNFLEIAHLHKG